ncbi:MAG: hypothetical protein JW966_07155 [Anaerolineae bacterium]|nr:hypothetical protein [Anaerolineae bacterium]
MEALQEMVSELWIGDEIHWDLALYWIAFINILVMLLQGDGATLQIMLSIIAVMSAVIDKTHGFGHMLDTGPYSPVKCHEEIFLGTYLIRVAMFVAPLTVAGSTKSPKSRGVAVVAGVSGGAYMFIRWYFEQRDVTSTKLTCSTLMATLTLQNMGMFLILARVALRDKLTLGAIHRHIPVLVPRNFATDDIEVDVA